jgi:hypothetical protein
MMKMMMMMKMEMEMEMVVVMSRRQESWSDRKKQPNHERVFRGLGTGDTTTYSCIT